MAARERFVLVTDAIGAAGLGGGADGEYPIGEHRTIHVKNGAARLADGTLAGSVLTMDQAIRNLVSLGVPVVDAIAAATIAPARACRRPDLGRLAPGAPADIAVLDDDLRVMRTLVGGHEVFAA